MLMVPPSPTVALPMKFTNNGAQLEAVSKRLSSFKMRISTTGEPYTLMYPVRVFVLDVAPFEAVSATV